MLRHKWQHQEKRLAKKLGGRRQPGSGCVPGLKGDVKSADFLVECKKTDHASHILTLKVLRKIDQEAALEGKEPLLEVCLQGYNYYVMTEGTFDYLMKEFCRLREDLKLKDSLLGSLKGVSGPVMRFDPVVTPAKERKS